MPLQCRDTHPGCLYRRGGLVFSCTCRHLSATASRSASHGILSRSISAALLDSIDSALLLNPYRLGSYSLVSWTLLGLTWMIFVTLPLAKLRLRTGHSTLWKYLLGFGPASHGTMRRTSPVAFLAKAIEKRLANKRSFIESLWEPSGLR